MPLLLAFFIPLFIRHCLYFFFFLQHSVMSTLWSAKRVVTHVFLTYTYKSYRILSLSSCGFDVKHTPLSQNEQWLSVPCRLLCYSKRLSIKRKDVPCDV